MGALSREEEIVRYPKKHGRNVRDVFALMMKRRRR